jgi:hypothetical protein
MGTPSGQGWPLYTASAPHIRAPMELLPEQDGPTTSPSAQGSASSGNSVSRVKPVSSTL